MTICIVFGIIPHKDAAIAQNLSVLARLWCPGTESNRFSLKEPIRVKSQPWHAIISESDYLHSIVCSFCYRSAILKDENGAADRASKKSMTIILTLIKSDTNSTDLLWKIKNTQIRSCSNGHARRNLHFNVLLRCSLKCDQDELKSKHKPYN